MILASAATYAQTPAPGTPPSVTLDKVEVTVSHIRRTESEGALPVQVITRDEIEKSGVTTVEQLLDRIPGNVNAINAVSVDFWTIEEQGRDCRTRSQ